MKLSKFLVLCFLAVFLLAADSFVAEATHDTSYSPYSGYNDYDKFGRGSYYGRDSHYSPFFDYGGTFQQTSNKNSRDLDRFTSLNNFNDRSSQFGEQLNSRTAGASLNLNRNLVDVNDFARSNTRGSSFDTGSLNYVEGDATLPTYKRELSINGRGKRNDLTITETIFGGPQIRYNRNFDTRNSFDTSSGFNRRALLDTFNADAQLSDTRLNRNTQNTQRERNSFSDRLSLRESDFGSGFSVNLNYR